MTGVSPDATAVAGETVALSADVEDPDGDTVTCRWAVDMNISTYAGAEDLSAWEHVATLDAPGMSETSFTVPADAHPGDRFVLTLHARDAAAQPATRYAQAAVTVK